MLLLGLMLSAVACATAQQPPEDQTTQSQVAQEPAGDQAQAGEPPAEEPAAQEPGEAGPADGEETVPTVLIVHSYHEGFSWTDAQDAAIRQALEVSGARVVSHYMDTKRHPDEDSKVQAGAEAKLLVEELQPTVIIATDDNAQKYFAKDYAGVEGAPQIVFSGVNAEPEEYGYPADNVTGVLERPKLAESLELLTELVPDVEKVAVVGDDSTTTDAMVAYTKSLTLPLEVAAYDQVSTFEEWQTAIEAHQTDADALVFFMYHTIKAQADGSEIMDPTEVMTWTLDNNELPTVGILGLQIDDGVMAGVVESPEEQGLIAGGLASELLDGTPAFDLGVRNTDHGQCMINLSTAATLGIEVPQELLDSCEIVE
jgi:ABC-type uncharacterized transport system substrate-binding protein